MHIYIYTYRRGGCGACVLADPTFYSFSSTCEYRNYLLTVFSFSRGLRSGFVKVSCFFSALGFGACF